LSLFQALSIATIANTAANSVSFDFTVPINHSTALSLYNNRLASVAADLRMDTICLHRRQLYTHSTNWTESLNWTPSVDIEAIDLCDSRTSCKCLLFSGSL